jgi:hypothetical protein
VLLADARAPAAEVQHRRRRNRDLGRARGAGLQVLEVGELDVLHVPHLVDHAHHGRCELLAAVGPLDHHRDVGFHAADLLEEVDVEVGAAELAVGDRLQADVLLESDDLGDRPVFHLAQVGGANLAFRLFLARLEQVFRTQEAAYVIGAERWRGSV